MTSISNYSKYKTICCNQEVSLPNYSSIGSNYRKPSDVFCQCNNLIAKSNLEFIIDEIQTPLAICEGGVDNYEIPFFLKKSI